MRASKVQVGEFYWYTYSTLVYVEAKHVDQCGRGGTTFTCVPHSVRYDEKSDSLLPDGPTGEREVLTATSLDEPFVCPSIPGHTSKYDETLDRMRQKARFEQAFREFVKRGAWAEVKRLGLKLRRKDMVTMEEYAAVIEELRNRPVLRRLATRRAANVVAERWLRINRKWVVAMGRRSESVAIPVAVPVFMLVIKGDILRYRWSTVHHVEVEL